nr:nucleotide sugar dehydrogenase [Aquella oligotrophica]
MKIAIVGTGYVGLVQGVVLSEFGMNVLCLDKDKTKIDKLKKGIVPIYEPGLEEVMARNIAANRLRFTTDSQEAFNFADIIFIAVGTPPAEDGSADLSHVRLVAEEIGQSIIGYKIIVNKSTVPVGTGRLVHDIITQQIKNRNVDARIDIVSNPEFLREGKAVQDCFKPDRVVIGCESENAKKIMQDIYNVLFINQTPFVFTNLETAELIKYASNAFLAVKISFINEIALLAEKVGLIPRK